MKQKICNKTKELLRFIVYILLPLTGGGWMGVSCSDMLEADSSRQLFDPALDQKTDSVYYAYGVMQAMQELADQYYFQNELRGDLVKTTDKASTHLQSLASFAADASNKYDSVYLYYKVINNCNYYLAHRDTKLATGSHNVVSNEYAAIASFRAWTYLQLTRQYGSVPYVTEPVTTIGQINANTEMKGYETILAGEAQMLEDLKARYTEDQLAVPSMGQDSRDIGKLNWGSQAIKSFNPSRCFIPLNVVLGDIYLELGEYEKAATCYYQYLRYEGNKKKSNISVNFTISLNPGNNSNSPIFKNLTEWPVDYNTTGQNKSTINWMESFDHKADPGDVISYIPMAVNYTMGKTTDIPAAFGYNYYSTEGRGAISSYPYKVDYNCPQMDKIQIVPSQVYCDSARNAQYYYFTEKSSISGNPWIVKNMPLGDARANVVTQGTGADTAYVYTYKPSTAYIYLYRNTTVWLHLAEAINRMGYPDAAFAVLKTGLHNDVKEYLYDVAQSQIDDKYFLTPESYTLLTTKLPFLADGENALIFKNDAEITAFVGIHSHGCGTVHNSDLTSTYRYATVLKTKIDDVYAKFSLGTPAYTKDDYINAMEDLLCDEYAMEFAFEGTRFSDLRRIALHKNRAGIYSGNFGDTWLSRMLQHNAAGITTQNCYLPYK